MRRLGRIVPGLWPDHNPLRRVSDRAEAGIIAGLVAAFLLGAPLIATVVWQFGLATAFTTTDAEHAGTRAGTTVTVWTGRSGRLTRTPLSESAALVQAAFTAGMAVPCWALLLLGTGVLSRRLLDARRLAAWDADWEALDPRGPAGANPGP